MNLPNLIIIITLTFYLTYSLKLLLPKNRIGIQTANKQLGAIRNKTYKSLAEQKNFLDLKYPKTIGTFKFTWGGVPKFVLQIILFLIVFRGFLFLFTYFSIEMKIWQALLFVIIFPIVINLVLEKFNVQKGDLRYLLRW